MIKKLKYNERGRWEKLGEAVIVSKINELIEWSWTVDDALLIYTQKINDLEDKVEPQNNPRVEQLKEDRECEHKMKVYNENQDSEYAMCLKCHMLSRARVPESTKECCLTFRENGIHNPECSQDK